MTYFELWKSIRAKLYFVCKSAPGANAMSACELTCSLVLSLARHVVPAAAALKAGRWDRALYTGTELQGKTLAILGLGRVGREVATRMHAFGMTVCLLYPHRLVHRNLY